MLFQGFRGLPGRIGSPGLNGEKVRPSLDYKKYEIRFRQLFVCDTQHRVFWAKQGDMGLPGTPGIPGLNGLTGRKVIIQQCMYFSYFLPLTYHIV